MDNMIRLICGLGPVVALKMRFLRALRLRSHLLAVIACTA